MKAVDPRYLDPSGWRPTALQYSISPEAHGETWERWSFKQQLAMPEMIRLWLSTHGPNIKESLEAVAASTGRDNYGLTGTKGKKTKKHDSERWKAFQASVKPV